MNHPLAVAVVGLGVGEAHARAYAALRQCELRWLHDLDEDRAQMVRDALRTAQVATSFSQILEDDTLGLVSIASYDDAHCTQTVAALDAGKHVFVEKPVSRTLEELRMVKAAWQRSRRCLMSNLILRAAPLFQWLRDAIAADEFGEIYAIDGDYLYGRLHKITDGWRRDVPDYSVVEGGGIHLLDLMLWLCGERPERVSACGNRIATRDSAFRYNDYVTATFEFPSGLIGRLTANFGCVHRHQHVLRVFGTAKTFIYDDAGARVHDSRDPNRLPRPITLAQQPETKGALIPGFVDAVLSGRDLSATTQHDFDVLCACVAADAATAARAPVNITYV